MAKGSLGIGRHLIAWAVLYLAVALAPLFVVLVGDRPPHRGFWIEFGVALGFVSLAMMAMQSVLTARFSTVSTAIGQDNLLQFHRQAGIVAYALVVGHPVVLILAEWDNWAFLDPRANLLRAAALWFALVAFPVLILSSLWRQQLKLPYEWWRLGHGVVAVLLVVVGLVHITRVAYYLASPWKLGLWLLLGVASIGCVVWVRVVSPWRAGRSPYRVEGVRPLADRTWSVTLEPTSDDPSDVIRFRPGQFAFVTLAESPYSLEQHPFSIASGAETHDRLEFAVRELGDFTGRIGTVAPGTRAFVDGPYGAMTLSSDAAGLFAVAGGIGITPIASMIRTIADAGLRMPVVLVYANNTPEDIAFAAELDRLALDLGDDLVVVHVLNRPPDGWDGPTGFVTAELLTGLLPDADRDRWQYVLCGPPPMMEAAENALLDHGVPLARIDSERFDIGAAAATGRRHANVRRLVVAIGAVLLAASVVFAL